MLVLSAVAGMLVVVLLLPLSYAMANGEVVNNTGGSSSGGGGGGGGGSDGGGQ